MPAPSTASAPVTADAPVTEQQVQAYRRDGFVHVPGIITAGEAAVFHDAALAAADRMRDPEWDQAVFTQCVNVWRDDEVMRRLTLHRRVAAAAAALAGVPLRLWHDQVLVKRPHNNAPTEFHQDQPYWPHGHSPHPISAWIALCDVPVERGCMTFIPGSHRHTELTAQNLHDAQSLMNLCPEMRWEPRVTLPLRAGDCTFHHGRCAHMATPNLTDQPRVAHVVIFVDRGTTYTGAPHVVTDPLGLKVGQVLPEDMFPGE